MADAGQVLTAIAVPVRARRISEQLRLSAAGRKVGRFLTSAAAPDKYGALVKRV